MRRALVLGLVGFIAFTVRRVHAKDDEDNLRPDVLACEEAVKKLVDCCDRFNPKAVTCTYFHHENVECDYTETTTETPSYSQDESECILARDCADLQASGVCGRAQFAAPYTESTCSSPDFCGSPSDESKPPHNAPVCP